MTSASHDWQHQAKFKNVNYSNNVYARLVIIIIYGRCKKLPLINEMLQVLILTFREKAHISIDSIPTIQ